MTTRTMTILFTDMVGSSELLTGLPDREAQGLRVAHFDLLDDQVQRHDGRLVKNLGDGVMATFGSAREGIQAAIAMQQAIVHGPYGGSRDRCAIRVGLSSGDVNLEGDDCFGAAVIEASRLCARAGSGQVLVTEATRRLSRWEESLTRLADVRLKGVPGRTEVWEVGWSHGPPRIRVVLADDAVLLRNGIARVLEDRGIEVVAQAGDADELVRLTAELRPDVAIVDVRMPPTYTVEGLDAAERILGRFPGTGVLILSQEVQRVYAHRLLAASSAGVGYLLKDRVADIRDFAETLRRIARGGQAFEPELLCDAAEAAG